MAPENRKNGWQTDPSYLPFTVLIPVVGLLSTAFAQGTDVAAFYRAAVILGLSLLGVLVFAAAFTALARPKSMSTKVVRSMGLKLLAMFLAIVLLSAGLRYIAPPAAWLRWGQYVFLFLLAFRWVPGVLYDR